MNFDIAIIGAGIVGAACAYRLSKEGFSVGIIEAKAVGGGSTAAGMGHIVVMDDSEAQFALTSLSRNLWNELAGQLTESSEFQNCGTIWIAADDIEMEEVQRKRKFYSERGIKCEILDEIGLRAAEPNLRSGLAGALYVPGDSVIYQLCATEFLLRSALGRGAKLVSGKKVVEVTELGVKLEDGCTISSDNVIIAAGVCSRELNESVKIVYKKGHLVITERYPDFVKHQLVELGYLKSAHSANRESVAFNIQPRRTDQLLIGSSRQFDVEDISVDYQIVQKMIERAFEFMPDLRKLTATRIWTGFRPATPDNLPYIGKSPNYNNIYIAAGHEGLGITTSLGTAELLTDEIVGRDSAISRVPYSPARFMEIN